MLPDPHRERAMTHPTNSPAADATRPTPNRDRPWRLELLYALFSIGFVRIGYSWHPVAADCRRLPVRMRGLGLLVIGWCVASLAGAAQAVTAGPGTVDPADYQALHWRLIGPFRGGRVLTVAGIPGDDR